MKKSHLAGMAALAALLASTTALAAGNAADTTAPKHHHSMEAIDGSLSPMTTMFIKKADMGGRFEIDSSKIALDRSQNPKVRSFAKTMIDDHTEAGENMKAALPKNAPEVGSGYDRKHAAMLSYLKNVSADKFDNLYISDQKAGHDEAIALYGKYAKAGDNKDLKEFAASTLPTIKEHREHLEGFHNLGANYTATTNSYNSPAKPHQEWNNTRVWHPITDSPNPAVSIVGKSEESPSVTLRH